KKVNFVNAVSIRTHARGRRGACADLRQIQGFRSTPPHGGPPTTTTRRGTAIVPASFLRPRARGRLSRAVASRGLTEHGQPGWPGRYDFISMRMPCTVLPEALSTRPAGWGAMRTTRQP